MTPPAEVKNLTEGRKRVLCVIATGAVMYRYETGELSGLWHVNLPRNKTSAVHWCLDQGLARFDHEPQETLAGLYALGRVPVRITPKGGRALGASKAVLGLVHGHVVMWDTRVQKAYGPVEWSVLNTLRRAGLVDSGKHVVASSETRYVQLTERGRALLDEKEG